MMNDNKFRQWYLSAVKSALILECGMMENEAENIIKSFNLNAKLKKNSFIADHYDPRSTALDLQEIAIVAQ